MTDNNNSTQTNPRMLLFMGLFATVMGLFVILVSVDIIHADPESIHAPRWVLTLAGMMFTFIGLHLFSTTMLSPGEQKTPVIQWVQYFLVLGMLTAFATVFLWVGFGGGEREFSSSGSIGFLTISGKGNDIIGRIMFGGGGVFAALITAYYAYTGARKIMSDTSNHNTP
jgi:hypothetical protein